MMERKAYLEQLLSLRDDPVIKVITGICRCGKSTLWISRLFATTKDASATSSVTLFATIENACVTS